MPRLAQEQGSDILAADHTVAVNPGFIEQPGSYVFRIGRIVLSSVRIEIDESVPTWDEGTTYRKGDIAQGPGAFMFVSKVDGNIGHALPESGESNEYWEPNLLMCVLPEAFWPEVELPGEGSTGGHVTTAGVLKGEGISLHRSWLAARSSP